MAASQPDSLSINNSEPLHAPQLDMPVDSGAGVLAAAAAASASDASGMVSPRRIRGREWTAGYGGRVAGTHVQPLCEEVALALGEVEHAISQGFVPTRVSQGSSGSYFVRNRHNRILGIFKPKDEEPYGDRNPKWTKYLHKTLLPCMFGRACLVANQGYISEAAAYAVDVHLGLGVVPPTNLVELASTSFNYSDMPADALILPPKLGSLQLFVSGFSDAQTFLDAHTHALGDATSALYRSFQRAFERLVALDYLIRNTDRGTDNWLARLDDTGAVAIAAIDNGLAFPFKHPDGLRTYPFAWAALPFPFVDAPFSTELREQLIPLLTRELSWDSLVSVLRDVFEIDTGFDAAMFQDIASVLRGQMANLLRALTAGFSPRQLITMQPMLVSFDPARGWIDPEAVSARACFACW